jgi:CRISPR-associated protein Cmr2
VKELANLLPYGEKGKYEPCKGLEQAKNTDDCWGTLNSIVAWLLDGTKSLRKFDAWSTGTWKSGIEFNKDVLTGKEEAVFSIDPQLSDKAVASIPKKLWLNTNGDLKAGESFGAANTIKRFWPVCYLVKALNMYADRLRQNHPMPNTHSIAQYEHKTDGGSEGKDGSEKYFAVIAMDGDEMGKWISSQKFSHAMTSNDHLEFSQILNDFSVNHAAGLVEKCNGRIIYSGGDDVLAMVPAGNALNCALDLRKTFVDLFRD